MPEGENTGKEEPPVAWQGCLDRPPRRRSSLLHVWFENAANGLLRTEMNRRWSSCNVLQSWGELDFQKAGQQCFTR